LKAAANTQTNLLPRLFVIISSEEDLIQILASNCHILTSKAALAAFRFPAQQGEQ